MTNDDGSKGLFLEAAIIPAGKKGHSEDDQDEGDGEEVDEGERDFHGFYVLTEFLADFPPFLPNLGFLQAVGNSLMG
jgi:hypothetical protein